MSPDEATAPPPPPGGPAGDDRSDHRTQSGREAGDVAPSADLMEGGRSRSLLGSPTGLLVALAAVAITLYGMRYAAGILNPILLAMFLVMGISPLIHWLRRKGLAPWATLVVVLLIFVVVVLLFIVVAAASLTQLDEKLPVYKENLSAVIADAQAWFSDHGIDISGLTTGALDSATLIEFAKNLIKGGINALTSIGLMIFIVLFMVSETFSFPRKLTDRVRMSDRARQSLVRFSSTVRSYLFTKAWLSAIMTVIVAIIYYAFGVDFALLWALLFFVLSFIPNIGFVLSVIPPFFVTLLESGFWPALAVVILVVAANTVVDNIISPRVMGESVGLSSLIVFLSLMLWAWVLGGIGALIAVPMTLMVKLLFFDSYESTQPLSEFMERGILDEHRKRKRRKKQEEAAAGAGAKGEPG